MRATASRRAAKCLPMEALNDDSRTRETNFQPKKFPARRFHGLKCPIFILHQIPWVEMLP
jgi:hypothetical protein